MKSFIFLMLCSFLYSLGAYIASNSDYVLIKIMSLLSCIGAFIGYGSIMYDKFGLLSYIIIASVFFINVLMIHNSKEIDFTLGSYYLIFSITMIAGYIVGKLIILFPYIDKKI